MNILKSLTETFNAICSNCKQPLENGHFCIGDVPVIEPGKTVGPTPWCGVKR